MQLEQQKLAANAEIENKKLALEREKLEAQKSAAKWSALTTVIPLAIGIFSLVLSIRHQTKMQQDAARLQFEIKAAEIAFSGKTPQAVANRTLALKQIFSERLPKNFATNFAPEEVGGDKEPSEDKKLFLEFLLKYPKDRSVIFDFWTTLFPGDEKWLGRMKSLLNSPIDFAPEEVGGGKEPSEDKKLFLEFLLKYPKDRSVIFDFWTTLFPGDEKWLGRMKSLLNSTAPASQVEKEQDHPVSEGETRLDPGKN
jgi:hypothetical protein